MASKNNQVVLGAWPLYAGMAIGAFLLSLLFSSLVQMLVLSTWDQAQLSQLQNERLLAASRLVRHQLSVMASGADGLAAALVTDAGQFDPAGVAHQSERARAALPELRRVVAFPLGRILRDTDPELPVSYAAVDLLKRAEQGERAPPEAFMGPGRRWYMQYAVALRDASGQVTGTLLAIYEPRSLQAELGQLPGGRYEVSQTVSGRFSPVFTAGEGEGAGVAQPLKEAPGWQVSYAFDARGFAADRDLMFWLVSGGAALVLTVFVLGGFLFFGRKAASDLSTLTAVASSLLSTGSSQPARCAFRLTRHAIGVLQQVRGQRPGESERRDKSAPVQPAAPAAPTVARTAAASAPAGDAEPLFASDDALDVFDEDDLLGLAEGREEPAPAGIEVGEEMTVEVDASMFRAYDIRGIAEQNLNVDVMLEIGRALGAEALVREQQTLCVGQDARHSSPALTRALIQGLLESGVNVIDVGVVPTPVLYFATHHFNTGSGAMVTGSHNPPEYNGVKMMLGGHTLADSDIQGLLARIRTRRFTQGAGKLEQRNAVQPYLDTIVADIAVAAPLKVVIDAGNGVAGEVATTLLGELGCDVVPIHCEMDGNFPAHHPDPSRPENLQSLIETVRETGADLGIAFDGDGDRLGVVTNTGKIIWPDRLLMLFAKDVVSRNPGADVVFDVKCSRRLNGLISGYGGRPVMWRSGHSVMKARMAETGALLGGELSGHIFFKERWYGFDDGIYSAARLLEILGIEGGSADAVFAEFPEDESTPELHITVGDQAKFAIMERLLSQAQWGQATITTLDGIRVEYADGWGLCRASNTTPTLALRFEAENAEALARIQETFREQLLAVEPGLRIPF